MARHSTNWRAISNTFDSCHNQKSTSLMLWIESRKRKERLETCVGPRAEYPKVKKSTCSIKISRNHPRPHLFLTPIPTKSILQLRLPLLLQIHPPKHGRCVCFRMCPALRPVPWLLHEPSASAPTVRPSVCFRMSGPSSASTLALALAAHHPLWHRASGDRISAGDRPSTAAWHRRRQANASAKERRKGRDFLRRK